MKPALGKMVRYMEQGREFPALITSSAESEEGKAHLTVFAPTGQSLRCVAYSEKLKEGFWSLPPEKIKK